MKWVFSNGSTLVVRDIGPILIQLEKTNRPLPIISPLETMEDDEARELIKSLLAEKSYNRII
jgi:hypothetical protein